MDDRLSNDAIPKGSIQVRQALAGDADVVSGILREAAAWLESRHMAMWRADELLQEHISKDVDEGLFFLAEHAGEPVGTIKV